MGGRSLAHGICFWFFFAGYIFNLMEYPAFCFPWDGNWGGRRVVLGSVFFPLMECVVWTVHFSVSNRIIIYIFLAPHSIYSHGPNVENHHPISKVSMTLIKIDHFFDYRGLD